MEDAHTAVLGLEEGNPDANLFFAVYDGHGGTRFLPSIRVISLLIPPWDSLGAAVAKYAGANVHGRLVHDEAYKHKDYKLALKNAFLGTDADMRASESTSLSLGRLPMSDLVR